MSHLEDQLKSALGRKEPGEDFTARLRRRLREPEARSWTRELPMLFRRPRRQWVAASLAVGLLAPFAALQYRHGREMRAQGEMAKQQLILAVRIAGTELRNAQQKVQRMTQMENQ